MTSFTTNPATITDGDTFTLSWAAPCGFVSLAQKGQGPFATLLPSTGTYALRPGLAGYPTAAGDTTYEARNADTATPREATVTMNTKPAAGDHAPTVTVSASPDNCHPEHWDSKPCTVTCKANASDQDGDALSYKWSGCATGTATTATCTFSQPGDADCAVTVSDGKGGSTTASKAVHGANAAPDVTPTFGSKPWYCVGVYYSNPQAGNTCHLRLNATDDDPAPSSADTVSAVAGTSGCQIDECYFMNVNQVTIDAPQGAAGSTCDLWVTITDDWGASTQRHLPYTIQ